MKYAWSDLSGAFTNIRAWSFLAYKQIQFEHRRSFMGSLWLVLAFAISSGGIAVLMAQLQGRPLHEHVPYVMFGFAAWNFITGCVTGGANVLTGARGYLLQMPISRSVFVLSLVLRHLYVLGLNIATAAVVAAFLGWRPTADLVWVLPAVAVFTVAGFAACMVTGLLAARIPDIGTLIGAVMRLAFFFTPIIWRPDSARGQVEGFIGLLVQWNPFSHFIYIFRDGVLSEPQGALHWSVCAAITAGLVIAAGLSLQLLGRRITYWL